MKAKIEKMKQALKSVRVRLFITLSVVILLIILFLILVNNFVFGQFYLFSKTRALKDVYNTVNNYYNNEENENYSIGSVLETVAIKNNFDILIKNDQNINVYTSDKDFLSTLGEMSEMTNRFHTDSGEVIENGDKFTIKRMKDNNNGVTYILL